jgi:hypothetical protein
MRKNLSPIKLENNHNLKGQTMKNNCQRQRILEQIERGWKDRQQMTDCVQ